MASYRDKLNQFKGKRSAIQEELQKYREEVEGLQKYLDRIYAAQTIIQTVAQQTQEQLRFHIESIVSMALEAVFPDPYQFKADFLVRRNQTECELSFARDDEKIEPLLASGGGPADVCALALRVTLWSLGKTRPILILDEPTKFVSRDLQGKVGQMISELGRKMGLQFIVTTHSRDLAEYADKTFEVMIRDGKSVVRER